MAKHSSCFITNVNVDLWIVDNASQTHHCVYCKKSYFLSQPRRFSYFYLEWNLECDMPSENHERMLSEVVLSECEPCRNGWIEICFILILMFIVWMIFMPFRKDRFLLALTIFQAMLSFLLCLIWKLIPWWILMASVIVSILRLGGRNKLHHSLFGGLVSCLQVIFAVFHINLGRFMPQNKQLVTLVDTIQKLTNLSAFHEHCWLSNLSEEILSKLIFIALLPVLVSCFSWIGFGIWYVFSDKQNIEMLSLVRNSCGSFCLSFLNFAYFPILTYVSSFIDTNSCAKVGHWISVLKNYPWLECGTSKVNHVDTIAKIIMVIYIAIPYVFFLPLVYRHRIQISNEREELNDSFWFSAIYLQYKAKYRVYMHTIILTKKIMMAYIISFGGRSLMAVGQVTSISLVLLCSLLPFEKEKKWAISRCRCCGLTRIVSKIGTENFFQIGFELVLLNVILLPLQRNYFFYNYNLTNFYFIFNYLPFMIVTESVVVLWVFYFIASFCSCERKDHSNDRLLTVGNSKLHNRYASLSRTYIVTDASHTNDDEFGGDNVSKADLEQ